MALLGCRVLLVRVRPSGLLYQFSLKRSMRGFRTQIAISARTKIHVFYIDWNIPALPALSSFLCSLLFLWPASLLDAFNRSVSRRLPTCGPTSHRAPGPDGCRP